MYAIFDRVEIVEINSYRNGEGMTQGELDTLIKREHLAKGTLNQLLSSKRYTILKVVSIPLEGRGNRGVEYHLGRLATVGVGRPPQHIVAEEFDDPERDAAGNIVGNAVDVLGGRNEES